MFYIIVAVLIIAWVLKPDVANNTVTQSDLISIQKECIPSVQRNLGQILSDGNTIFENIWDEAFVERGA